MRVKWCDRALLFSPYHYCLCVSEKQFHAELKRIGVKKENWLLHKNADATTHFYESASSLCAFVCIPPAPGKTIEQIYALITHEAMHIWREIKNELGEHDPGTETEAYAIQNIAQNLMISYSEQTKEVNQNETEKTSR